MFKIIIIYIYIIRFVLAQDECPYYLIKNTEKENVNKYCLKDCCIPCPLQNYFYNKYNIEYDFNIINILRIISTFLSIIIMIMYFIKFKKNKFKNEGGNEKRSLIEKNTNIIIICLSFSIFLFSSISLFVINNPKRIQCKDILTKSTQNNNLLCSIQGGILIFSSFCTVVWIFVLILDFHINKIWNNNYIITNHYFNNILIWFIPFVITFTILTTNNISYEFANLCLVSVDNIYNMFFYPLGCIVFLGFLILLISLIIITYKYIYTNVDFYMYDQKDEYKVEMKKLELNKTIDIFKYHWRYILIGLITIFTISFYWLFYYKEINKLKELFKDIIECSHTQTIDICINSSISKLPSYKLMVVAETLVSIVGIWLFIIFIDITYFKNYYKKLKQINIFNSSDKNKLLNHI